MNPMQKESIDSELRFSRYEFPKVEVFHVQNYENRRQNMKVADSDWWMSADSQVDMRFVFPEIGRAHV